MKLSKPMKHALAQFNAEKYQRAQSMTVRSNTLCALEKKGLIERPKPQSIQEALNWRNDWASCCEWRLTDKGAQMMSRKTPSKSDE